MWANYHTHTSFCDGTDGVTDLVEQAIDQKVVSLGLSSHAPLPFHTKWAMKCERFEEYLSAIQQHKSTIELYSGLEVDFIPGVTGPQDFDSRLDYTIGSIHFVDQFADGTRWEIDGPHETFLTGLHDIFSDNIRECVARYFQLTREMIEKSPPHIIGHLDKIKIQNIGGKFYGESEQWYVDEVIKTLDSIKRSNVIVEVNTRGLYQKKSQSLYPSDWILAEILTRKIPVTISSDAHLPRDLTNTFSTAAQKLLSIGFRKISILSEHSWKQVTLTPDGIKP